MSDPEPYKSRLERLEERVAALEEAIGQGQPAQPNDDQRQDPQGHSAPED